MMFMDLFLLNPLVDQDSLFSYRRSFPLLLGISDKDKHDVYETFQKWLAMVKKQNCLTLKELSIDKALGVDNYETVKILK